MDANQLQCSSCGHIMNLEEAVGAWIECPNCHSRFLINNLSYTEESDEKREYYFPSQCDFQSFRHQCFDLMMQSSPADIFSELKVMEEIQCYLPYVSRIGGDSDSTYDAEYVGADNHAVIMQWYAHLSYKNNDKRFGTFRRTKKNENDNLEKVHTDDARVAALPQWATHCDELHYYPFYCLVCNYKGTTFSFSSLGNADFKTTKLPTDGNLRKGPSLIKLTNSERVSYAEKAAKIVVLIVAVCLICYFWKEIINYIADRKANLYEQWEIMHFRSGWFAYVLIVIYFACTILKGAFFPIVGATITFIVAFCILWLAIVIGVFLHNRYVTHRCLDRLKQTQKRKQHDAQTLHNFHLSKLYDQEKDLY